MKNLKLLPYLLICLIVLSCTKESVENPIEENLQSSNKSSLNCPNFGSTCNSTTTLFDSEPFDRDFFIGDPGQGWNNGFDCGNLNANDCFGVVLRRNLIREFGKHNNNISCGLKGTLCPTNTTTLFSCNYILDIDSEWGVDTDDGILEENEANIIYQEMMCELLNFEDNNDSEFIVINEITVDTLLCCSGWLISIDIEMHKVN